MKTVKVDEWFHEYLKTEKRENETMGEVLVRLTGAPGPDPELVAGIISEEKGEAMLKRIEKQDKSSVDEVRREIADDS
jgi:predicted CopG family antitoxin